MEEDLWHHRSWASRRMNHLGRDCRRCSFAHNAKPLQHCVRSSSRCSQLRFAPDLVEMSSSRRLFASLAVALAPRHRKVREEVSISKACQASAGSGGYCPGHEGRRDGEIELATLHEVLLRSTTVLILNSRCHVGFAILMWSLGFCTCTPSIRSGKLDSTFILRNTCAEHTVAAETHGRSRSISTSSPCGPLR